MELHFAVILAFLAVFTTKYPSVQSEQSFDLGFWNDILNFRNQQTTDLTDAPRNPDGIFDLDYDDSDVFEYENSDEDSNDSSMHFRNRYDFRRNRYISGRRSRKQHLLRGMKRRNRIRNRLYERQRQLRTRNQDSESSENNLEMALKRNRELRRKRTRAKLNKFRSNKQGVTNKRNRNLQNKNTNEILNNFNGNADSPTRYQVKDFAEYWKSRINRNRVFFSSRIPPSRAAATTEAASPEESGEQTTLFDFVTGSTTQQSQEIDDDVTRSPQNQVTPFDMTPPDFDMDAQFQGTVTTEPVTTTEMGDYPEVETESETGQNANGTSSNGYKPVKGRNTTQTLEELVQHVKSRSSVANGTAYGSKLRDLVESVKGMEFITGNAPKPSHQSAQQSSEPSKKDPSLASASDEGVQNKQQNGAFPAVAGKATDASGKGKLVDIVTSVQKDMRVNGNKTDNVAGKTGSELEKLVSSVNKGGTPQANSALPSRDSDSTGASQSSKVHDKSHPTFSVEIPPRKAGLQDGQRKSELNTLVQNVKKEGMVQKNYSDSMFAKDMEIHNSEIIASKQINKESLHIDQNGAGQRAAAARFTGPKSPTEHLNNSHLKGRNDNSATIGSKTPPQKSTQIETPNNIPQTDATSGKSVGITSLTDEAIIRNNKDNNMSNKSKQSNAVTSKTSRKTYDRSPNDASQTYTFDVVKPRPSESQNKINLANQFTEEQIGFELKELPVLQSKASIEIPQMTSTQKDHGIMPATHGNTGGKMSNSYKHSTTINSGQNQELALNSSHKGKKHPPVQGERYAPVSPETLTSSKSQGSDPSNSVGSNASKSTVSSTLGSDTKSTASGQNDRDVNSGVSQGGVALRLVDNKGQSPRKNEQKDNQFYLSEKHNENYLSLQRKNVQLFDKLLKKNLKAERISKSNVPETFSYTSKERVSPSKTGEKLPTKKDQQLGNKGKSRGITQNIIKKVDIASRLKDTQPAGKESSDKTARKSLENNNGDFTSKSDSTSKQSLSSSVSHTGTSNSKQVLSLRGPLSSPVQASSEVTDDKKTMKQTQANTPSKSPADIQKVKSDLYNKITSLKNRVSKKITKSNNSKPSANSLERGGHGDYPSSARMISEGYPDKSRNGKHRSFVKLSDSQEIRGGFVNPKTETISKSVSKIPYAPVRLTEDLGQAAITNSHQRGFSSKEKRADPRRDFKMQNKLNRKSQPKVQYDPVQASGKAGNYINKNSKTVYVDEIGPRKIWSSKEVKGAIEKIPLYVDTSAERRHKLNLSRGRHIRKNGQNDPNGSLNPQNLTTKGTQKTNTEKRMDINQTIQNKKGDNIGKQIVSSGERTKTAQGHENLLNKQETSAKDRKSVANHLNTDALENQISQGKQSVLKSRGIAGKEKLDTSKSIIGKKSDSKHSNNPKPSSNGKHKGIQSGKSEIDRGLNKDKNEKKQRHTALNPSNNNDLMARKRFFANSISKSKMKKGNPYIKNGQNAIKDKEVIDLDMSPRKKSGNTVLVMENKAYKMGSRKKNIYKGRGAILQSDNRRNDYLKNRRYRKRKEIKPIRVHVSSVRHKPMKSNGNNIEHTRNSNIVDNNGLNLSSERFRGGSGRVGGGRQRSPLRRINDISSREKGIKLPAGVSMASDGKQRAVVAKTTEQMADFTGNSGDNTADKGAIDIAPPPLRETIDYTMVGKWQNGKFVDSLKAKNKTMITGNEVNGGFRENIETVSSMGGANNGEGSKIGNIFGRGFAEDKANRNDNSNGNSLPVGVNGQGSGEVYPRQGFRDERYMPGKKSRDERYFPDDKTQNIGVPSDTPAISVKKLNGTTKTIVKINTVSTGNNPKTNNPSSKMVNIPSPVVSSVDTPSTQSVNNVRTNFVSVSKDDYPATKPNISERNGRGSDRRTSGNTSQMPDTTQALASIQTTTPSQTTQQTTDDEVIDDVTSAPSNNAETDQDQTVTEKPDLPDYPTYDEHEPAMDLGNYDDYSFMDDLSASLGDFHQSGDDDDDDLFPMAASESSDSSSEESYTSPVKQYEPNESHVRYGGNGYDVFSGSWLESAREIARERAEELEGNWKDVNITRVGHDTSTCPNYRVRYQDDAVVIDTIPNSCRMIITWNKRQKREQRKERTWWGTRVYYKSRTVYVPVVTYVDLR